jgi:hypothetical protein
MIGSFKADTRRKTRATPTQKVWQGIYQHWAFQDVRYRKNKKFWEEPIAYFPLKRHGPQRK